MRTSKTTKNPQTQVSTLSTFILVEKVYCLVEKLLTTFLVTFEDFGDFEEFKDFPLEGGFIDGRMGKSVVEARGFEPPTPASRTQCATGLRYASIQAINYYKY